MTPLSAALPIAGTTSADAASAAPVWFRGRPFSARKDFWDGTQRVVAPAVTLARARAHFKRIGVTRLANVTGLDRIGIPTILSIRPNSGFLSVDAGKGFTVEAAMASAAMESIERFHAENPEIPFIRATYEQIAREHVVVPADRLPLRRHQFFSRQWPHRWTLGWDLVAQRDVAAPTAIVTMDTYKPEYAADVQPFLGGSNGLSAGNTFLEAVTGGLLEVIERDAWVCQKVAEERSGRRVPRVRLDTVTYPPARELLERFERAGVGVVLFDCSVDTRVPVYMSYVYDRESRHIGIYGGYGAHLEPGIAMVRALTEAVQGRLIFIAGSRDDFFRHNYLRLKNDDDEGAIRLLESIPASVDARERESLAAPTFEGDVHRLIDLLKGVGLTQVIVVDLTLPGFDVSTVRVIVPGLEGYKSGAYAPGPRARAFCEENRP